MPKDKKGPTQTRGHCTYLQVMICFSLEELALVFVLILQGVDDGLERRRSVLGTEIWTSFSSLLVYHFLIFDRYYDDLGGLKGAKEHPRFSEDALAHKMVADDAQREIRDPLSRFVRSANVSDWSKFDPHGGSAISLPSISFLATARPHAVKHERPRAPGADTGRWAKKCGGFWIFRPIPREKTNLGAVLRPQYNAPPLVACLLRLGCAPSLPLDQRKRRHRAPAGAVRFRPVSVGAAVAQVSV